MEIKVKRIRGNANLPVFSGGEDKSDWCDLYVSEIEICEQTDIQSFEVLHTITKDGSYWGGECGNCFLIVKFGIAMELPDGYEAILAPRSSTFKKHGITLTNSFGVIDNAYKGDNDEWMSVWKPQKPGQLYIGDRIAQFRIQRCQPKITFKEVQTLGNENRGGFGTTGTK